MSSEAFWNLTWYDWGLWLHKIRSDREKHLADRELTVEMTRSFMALFANVNRSKTSKTYEPSDFFKLSYDEHNKDLTEIDVKAFERRGKEFFEKLKNRHNKKKNG